MRKSDCQLGMELILNNPKTSFLKNPDTLNEIVKQSGMGLTNTIKYIGKSSKKGIKKEPVVSDDERSKSRLATLAESD